MYSSVSKRFQYYLLPNVYAEAKTEPDGAVDEESTDEDGNLEDPQGKKKKKEKVGFRDRKVIEFVFCDCVSLYANFRNMSKLLSIFLHCHVSVYFNFPLFCCCI